MVFGFVILVSFVFAGLLVCFNTCVFVFVLFSGCCILLIRLFWVCWGVALVVFFALVFVWYLCLLVWFVVFACLLLGFICVVSFGA